MRSVLLSNSLDIASASRKPLTFDPLRLESGFLDYRNLGEYTALFSSHQREALDEADTLKVTIASAECADCGGLRYSPLCDGTRYSSGADSCLCTRALLTLPQTLEPTRLQPERRSGTDDVGSGNRRGLPEPTAPGPPRQTYIRRPRAGSFSL